MKSKDYDYTTTILLKPMFVILISRPKKPYPLLFQESRKFPTYPWIEVARWI